MSALRTLEEEEDQPPYSPSESLSSLSPAPSPAASEASSIASSSSCGGGSLSGWPEESSRSGPLRTRCRKSSRRKSEDLTSFPIKTHRSPYDEQLQEEFLTAAAAVDCAKVEQILNAAAPGALEVDRYGRDGRTVLLRTCDDTVKTCISSKRRLELVRLLVRNGADVTLRTREGWSALHVAAFGNSPELVAYLLGCKKDRK